MTSSRAPARYAVYFAPAPETALWDFGRRVIGYDSYRPTARAPQSYSNLGALLSPDDLSEPARYGFHATLRAPFELSPAHSADHLLELARNFAKSRDAVSIGALQVTQMSGFIALVPTSPPPALAELAASCVRSFEPIRAPLSTTDRTRRLMSPLTPRQIGYVDTWGYPYVLEDFTFHMTLTGRLDEETGMKAMTALKVLHAKISADVTIDAITVLEQTTRKCPFRVIERFPFAGTAV
jgi:hypothetical protein